MGDNPLFCGVRVSGVDFLPYDSFVQLHRLNLYEVEVLGLFPT